MFGQLGLQQRARELFRRAVAARPDVPQYLFNLAAAEADDPARSAMPKHIATRRLHATVVTGSPTTFAQTFEFRSHDRNHIDEMEALLRDGRLSEPGEIMLRFALGKECEDIELWGRAFDHVEAGCNLQRRSLSRDLAAEIGEIDAIIHAHTRRWIESAPRGRAEAAPVFVTGLPRTGTTLVERIIASHSAMHSFGETSAFAAEMRRVMAERPSGRDLEGIGKR